MSVCSLCYRNSCQQNRKILLLESSHCMKVETSIHIKEEMDKVILENGNHGEHQTWCDSGWTGWRSVTSDWRLLWASNIKLRPGMTQRTCHTKNSQGRGIANGRHTQAWCISVAARRWVWPEHSKQGRNRQRPSNRPSLCKILSGGFSSGSHVTWWASRWRVWWREQKGEAGTLVRMLLLKFQVRDDGRLDSGSRGEKGGQTWKHFEVWVSTDWIWEEKKSKNEQYKRISNQFQNLINQSYSSNNFHCIRKMIWMWRGDILFLQEWSPRRQVQAEQKNANLQ